MSANTSPDNITYPTSTDSFGPLETSFATLAATVQTALNNTKTYRTADHISLAAITGMSTGAIATVIEGGAIFAYDGSVWVQKTPATFNSFSTRDAAYAKAAGVYRTVYATVFRSDLNGSLQRYNPSTSVWTFFNTPGLVPIIPSSVNGGVTSPSGIVTPTSAQALVRLNGVFSADFENYIIKFSNLQPSAGAILQARLSSGAADDSTANWTAQIQQAGASAVVAGASSGATSATLANANNVVVFGNLDLYRPAVADFTHMVSDIWGITSGTSGTLFKQGLRHNVATGYDGITFFWSAGTWTAGSIMVYGYNH